MKRRRVVSGSARLGIALIVLWGSATAPLTGVAEEAAADPGSSAHAEEAADRSPGPAASLVDAAPDAGPPSEPTSAESTPSEATGRTLREWYALGGWIMHVLLVCSILVTALVLERLWQLRRGAVIPQDLVAGLRAAQAEQRMERAGDLCAHSVSSLARIVGAAIQKGPPGAPSSLERASVAGASEALHLRRNLPLLSALANIATLLGLLGTVLGMIQAFDRIAEVGGGDARVVAGGIFAALVTTAAGLSVGILALGWHAYFRRRVESMLLALEDLVGELFDPPAATAEGTDSLATAALASASR